MDETTIVPITHYPLITRLVDGYPISFEWTGKGSTVNIYVDGKNTEVFTNYQMYTLGDFEEAVTEWIRYSNIDLIDQFIEENYPFADGCDDCVDQLKNWIEDNEDPEAFRELAMHYLENKHNSH